MSKGRDLAKNTLILAIGKFSTQFITFLLLPLYTSYLAPSDYGIVDLVITYAVLLSPSMTLQMEMATFRFLIDARDDEREKSRVISNALQVVTSIALLFIIVYLVAMQFIRVPYTELVAMVIVLTIFSGWCLQTARGLGKNANFAIASFIMSLTTVISNIVAIVYLHMGARGLLSSLVLAHVAGIIYLIISLKLHRYVRFDMSDSAFKKELLRYSAPLVPNGISWWVINGADRTIIAIFIGLTGNGIFAIASKFALVFNSIFAVFGMSWTEAASVHINDRDRDKFFSYVANATLKFFGSLGIVIIALLPFVFPILVNPQYKEAYVYVPVLIVSSFFNSIVGIYSAVYVAKKMTKQVASTSILAAVISISINLILIRFTGLFAAAFANAIAFLSMAVYRHYDLKKYVVISYSKTLVVSLAVAYTFILSLYYADNVVLQGAGLAAAIAFATFFNRNLVSFIKSRVIKKVRGGVK